MVMLSLANGKYFGLNATAQAIWERMAQPVSIEDLSLALQARFEVDRDRAADAVLALVRRLIEEKVARIAS